MVLDEKFATLGEAGIARPKDALLFVNNLDYKTAGGAQLTCFCMFCNLRITSTGSSRVVDHLSVPLRTLLSTLDHSSGACVNSGEWPKIHVKRW